MRVKNNRERIRIRFYYFQRSMMIRYQISKLRGFIKAGTDPPWSAELLSPVKAIRAKKIRYEEDLL